MSLKPILIHPDPRLKKVADPIARITPEVETLAADMLATMYDAPGIGLAGPQIGVNSRIFVMDATRDPEAEPAPMVLINPEISWSSEAQNSYEEGCLSIPDQYASVTRPSEVRLTWLGLDGATHEREFDGLWATCAQHELDHLNGVLFIDHLSAMKRQMITRKMVKLKREQARG
ncbi:peptide deformylase [Paracoccus sp. 1_MG-2023]|uniref:peptide deformylase n=1 Tax=unclassified Paracoccus (in: a-proteobacteria) TaxID=2688777 RepID=UPI001C08260C|nr:MULTISPECIES: peptide deformylase [unclassified Paracoccus (in: a-proteobacteria)]MBU2957017.1 peptide deformylase [Paracoccus sp. C2R09]MDO6668214.1 peptide deformylase [Paracoccus sp. 1_MG-2023]